MCRESNVKEQITFSRSFAKPVTARNEMERVLSVYTQRGAGRFQKQNSVTKTMSLFASTSPSAEQPNSRTSMLRWASCFPWRRTIRWRWSAQRSQRSGLASASVHLTSALASPSREPQAVAGRALAFSGIEFTPGEDATVVAYATPQLLTTVVAINGGTAPGIAALFESSLKWCRQAGAEQRNWRRRCRPS